MRIFAVLSVLSAAAGAVLLPTANGPYGVSMFVESLTDESRIDPVAPGDERHQRQVLISIFLPIDTTKVPSEKRTIPYMTPRVAQVYDTLAESIGLPNDTFASFEVESMYVEPEKLCGSSQKTRSQASNTDFPLVLFSPGSGQSRLLYGVMARSLASEGYAVVTVDHPYDAPVVEFPDGRIVTSANVTADDEDMTKVRAADMSFVIDQLQTLANVSLELSKHKASIEFREIVMYGHSLGGATAAAAMLSDPRIKGGVDLDGRFFNPVLNKGLRRPFALLGRPGHRSEDATWPQFFSKLRGPRFEMEVAKTLHGSFTDFPVLIDSLNLPEPAKSMAAELVGNISGKSMDVVVKGVMVAFCDFVFGGKDVPAVLKKGQKKIPELTVLASDACT